VCSGDDFIRAEIIDSYQDPDQQASEKPTAAMDTTTTTTTTTTTRVEQSILVGK
jgi:hypothetical protein